MISEIYQCEFITPCFGTGATQTLAELRASEVRGQLRWWFRALGGTWDQESFVFGSIHEKVAASALQVRTKVTKTGIPWVPPKVNPQFIDAYIWYYASESNNKSRWTEKGNFSPGTEFEIQIRQMRSIPKEANDLFQTALKSFLMLGALGMRVTRGLGAFSCKQWPATNDNIASQRKELEDHSFEWYHNDVNLGPDWLSAINSAGDMLKNHLRVKYPAGKSGDKQSPLGSSKPRQTSAVYLRPIRMVDGTYSLVLFEAPSERVLGIGSRCGAPVLRSLTN